jgi:hypothetical protein
MCSDRIDQIKSLLIEEAKDKPERYLNLRICVIAKNGKENCRILRQVPEEEL